MANKKPKSEINTRKDILKTALRFYGPEGHRQVTMHLDKYDNLLKRCGNESERKHIKLLGISELHTMLGIQTGLEVNGIQIIPSKEPPPKLVDEN